MKNYFLKHILTVFFFATGSFGFGRSNNAIDFSLNYLKELKIALSDTVPGFRMDQLKIGVPKDTPYYGADPKHEKGDMAVYNIEGMIPGKKENALISAEKGPKEYEISKTPYMLLCRLLKAYAKGDVAAVKELYVSGDAKKIDEMLSDSDTKKRFSEFMKAIRDFQLLLTYKISEGLLVIVRVNMKKGDSTVMPFLTGKVKDEWYLKAGQESSQMFSNIMMYLMAGKDPQKLIISSKPKK